MIDLEDCKTLNDIARKFFYTANYANREKAKKLLYANGIEWEEWIKLKKEKSKKFCLVCGGELSGSQKKFCSHACSASFNNKKRKVTLETRKKISKTLQKNKENDNICPLKERTILLYEKNKEEKKFFCKNCNKELLNKHQLYFCNALCQREYEYKQYIERWKNGEESGLSGEYNISKHIRKYLLEKNSCKCELCGWGEKNAHTGLIPLEVHHKDGNYTNNSEDNLQLLCPNCHSLTETYKSHNKKGRCARKKYCK